MTLSMLITTSGALFGRGPSRYCALIGWDQGVATPADAIKTQQYNDPTLCLMWISELEYTILIITLILLTINIFFSGSVLGQCRYKYPEGLQPQNTEENIFNQAQSQRTAQVLLH